MVPSRLMDRCPGSLGLLLVAPIGEPDNDTKEVQGACQKAGLAIDIYIFDKYYIFTTCPGVPLRYRHKSNQKTTGLRPTITMFRFLGLNC